MTVAVGVAVAAALAGCGDGHSSAPTKPDASASPSRPAQKPRPAGLDPAHLPAGWSLVAWPAVANLQVFGQSSPPAGDDAAAATAQSEVPPIGRSAELPTSTLANPNAEGAPLALLVQRYRPNWLKVSLPVRPNGTTGWVRTKDVRLMTTPFAVAVDKTRHELTVFKDGKPAGVYPVGIGTGTTPTPVGHFYLAELLKPADPAGPWGPYAFGLSGFSDVITNFDGGNGIIGLHGTNQPDRVGTDVSMGCIRLRNSDITALADLLPVGTPIAIT